MSSKYFLYTKTAGHPANDITGCQIINPASYASMIFVLPDAKIHDYYNGGLIEGNIIEWTKQFCAPNGIFLDVGSETGVYSICLSELCQKVYAFEPKKMDYYALCGSVAMSNKENITCLQDNGEYIDSLVNDLVKEETHVKFIRISSECNALRVIMGAENIIRINKYPTLLLNTEISNELSEFLERNLQYRIVPVSGYNNMYLAVCR